MRGVLRCKQEKPVSDFSPHATACTRLADRREALRGSTVAFFSSECFDDPRLRSRHKQRVYPAPPALDGQSALLPLCVERGDLFASHELLSIPEVRL